MKSIWLWDNILNGLSINWKCCLCIVRWFTIVTSRTLHTWLLVTCSSISDADTQGWIIAAISKLVSQMGNFTDEAQSHVACYLASINIDLQQVGGALSACCLTVKSLYACMYVHTYICMYACNNWLVDCRDNFNFLSLIFHYVRPYT